MAEKRNIDMQGLLLGLDIGTSSVKGLLCDMQGNVIAQAERPNELLSAQPGWAEQQVSLWEQNLIAVIQDCLHHPQVSAQQIRCIGVSGMIPVLVLLDSNGKVLRPAILYNDARAVHEIQEFNQQIGPGQFFNHTGAELSVQSVGPKWVWLQRHEPEIMSKTAWIMGSYDYINFFLTGAKGVERNWALESGLYDLAGQNWSDVLVSLFDLPGTVLPTIRQPFEIIGALLPEIAQISGLKAGTPVIAGSADHVAAALAAGVNQPGDVLLKFGSSGDILYCADRLVVDPRLYIDFHNLPGKYLPNGCMATSGSLLKWFVNEFCQQDILDAARIGMNVYEYLDLQAAKIPPGSEGVVVLPYFLGAKTPLNNPHARGTFYGMTLAHSRFHLYRAVMESVVFGFLDHIAVLNDLNLPIVRVIASEGGARSTLWRQITADVLGIPVEYALDNLGSAYGAAMVAGMAVSSSDLEQAELTALPRFTSEPDLHSHDAYQASYKLYKTLYQLIGDVKHLR